MSTEQVIVWLDRLRQSTREAQESWRRTTAEVAPRAPDATGENATITLTLANAQATTAALTIYEIDREMRRAVQVVRSEFRSERPHRTVARTFSPLPISAGGLEIKTATPGSLDVFFAAFGAVEYALLSNPVQLALTLRELLGWSGRLVVVVRDSLGTRERIAYQREAEVEESSDSVQIKAGPDGISVSSIPDRTTVRIEQRLTDGTETRIEIFRQ